MVVVLVVTAGLLKYGALWFQAYMSSADVSVMSVIGMSFRQVKPSMIVTAKIMGAQAGLNTHRRSGMSTARLEALFRGWRRWHERPPCHYRRSPCRN